MQRNQYLELSTTNILVSFNIALFVVATLLGLIYSGSLGNFSEVFLFGQGKALAYLGGDVYQHVLDGQVWRAVTSSFLHAGIIHLTLNMYALKSFGDYYERQYGGRSLFSLYVLAGIGAAGLSMVFTAFSIFIGLKDPYTYTVSVGASGALFGIIGFFLVSKDTYINRQALYMIIIINLFIGLSFSGRIDNGAHIGGLIAGALFGLTKWRLQSGLLFYISLLILLFSYTALFLFHIF